MSTKIAEFDPPFARFATGGTPLTPMEALVFLIRENNVRIDDRNAYLFGIVSKAVGGKIPGEVK